MITGNLSSLLSANPAGSLTPSKGAGAGSQGEDGAFGDLFALLTAAQAGAGGPSLGVRTGAAEGLMSLHEDLVESHGAPLTRAYVPLGGAGSPESAPSANAGGAHVKQALDRIIAASVGRIALEADANRDVRASGASQLGQVLSGDQIADVNALLKALQGEGTQVGALQATSTIDDAMGAMRTVAEQLRTHVANGSGLAVAAAVNGALAEGETPEDATSDGGMGVLVDTAVATSDAAGDGFATVSGNAVSGRSAQQPGSVSGSSIGEPISAQRAAEIARVDESIAEVRGERVSLDLPGLGDGASLDLVVRGKRVDARIMIPEGATLDAARASVSDLRGNLAARGLDAGQIQVQAAVAAVRADMSDSLSAQGLSTLLGEGSIRGGAPAGSLFDQSRQGQHDNRGRWAMADAQEERERQQQAFRQNQKHNHKGA